MYKVLFKRMFDLFVSFVLIILLSPLIIAISILVRCRISRKVLFIQHRPGYREIPFPLIKFRTMTDKRAPDGNLLPDLERIPKYGRLLRKTSLDELPGLLNVIRNEMSLVGPRPLLMEYLPLYSREQKKRHDVKPGLTGLAQVNGRNQISWNKRFELDTWYVENQSFCLDLKILLQTIGKVLKKEGVDFRGEATLSKFNGEN